MTRLDQFRAMSVEEIAKLIDKYVPSCKMPKEVREIWMSNHMPTVKAWRLWLSNEVGELSVASHIKEQMMNDSEIRKCLGDFIKRMSEGLPDVIALFAKKAVYYIEQEAISNDSSE